MTAKSMSNIISHQQLLNAEQFADFHFILDDTQKVQSIPAHKVLLISKSDYFDKILSKNNDITLLAITRVSRSVFLEFLQFFYTTSVKLTVNNIEHVIKLVKEYGVVDALQLCEHFLKTNTTSETALMFYGIYAEYRLSPKLIERLEEIVFNDPNNVFNAQMCTKIDKIMLEYLLRSNKWKCSELIIFKYAIRWAIMSIASNGKIATPATIRIELGDCLYRIGFALMTLKQLAGVLEKYPGLLTRGEYVDILNYITDNRPLTVAKQFRKAARIRIFDIDTCEHGRRMKFEVSEGTEVEAFIDQSVLYFKILDSKYYNRLAIRKLAIGIKAQPWGVHSKYENASKGDRGGSKTVHEQK